jgi:transcriptional regulator with XRE-family HTH domain
LEGGIGAAHDKEQRLTMNEFQLTLSNHTAQQGMSISELASRMGYDPLLFEKIVIGTNRRIPVDFFIRIADVLDLTRAEKDALVSSWAFGVDRWNWSQSYEAHQTEQPDERKVG